MSPSFFTLTLHGTEPEEPKSWFVLTLDTSAEEPEPEPQIGGGGQSGTIIAAPISFGPFKQQIPAEVTLEREFEQAISAQVELRPRIFSQRVAASTVFSRDIELRVEGVRLSSNRYVQALEEDELILLMS